MGTARVTVTPGVSKAYPITVSSWLGKSRENSVRMFCINWGSYWRIRLLSHNNEVLTEQVSLFECPLVVVLSMTHFSPAILCIFVHDMTSPNSYPFSGQLVCNQSWLKHTSSLKKTAIAEPHPHTQRYKWHRSIWIRGQWILWSTGICTRAIL